MNKYWSQGIEALLPYTPGEQPKVSHLNKLNTNENPYPPSPKVLQNIAQYTDESLRLYPDPEALALKQCIADYYQLDVNQVFAGNGSDEVLAHTFVALLKHQKPLYFPAITYSFYPVYSQLFAIDFKEIPLNKALAIDFDLYNACGAIIFPNPNAPTGHLSSLACIEKLLTANPDCPIVIDEAYIDFAKPNSSAIPLIKEFDNLLVIQTLSKSRSLAGLRVGFAIGHPALIKGLERVKNSFNSYPLNRLSIAGAIAAINDQDYFLATTEKIIRSRECLANGLLDLHFHVIPSSANFLFVSHAKIAALKILERLREKNILVRHFKQPGIDNYLRISIGTEEQCSALMASLSQIVLT